MHLIEPHCVTAVDLVRRLCDLEKYINLDGPQPRIIIVCHVSFIDTRDQFREFELDQS